MANMRNTKRFRERAALLRQQAGLHGVNLVSGEAEDILAERLTAVASQMGVTERTALDSYVTEHFVTMLAETLGKHNATYIQIADEAEPMTIPVGRLGSVVAAQGMVFKLATEHVERTRGDALGTASDASDAVVGLGVAIAKADALGDVEVDGRTLVYARKVLVRTIELLRDGSWDCPRCGHHQLEKDCVLVRQLTMDLATIGGWTTGAGERFSN